MNLMPVLVTSQQIRDVQEKTFLHVKWLLEKDMNIPAIEAARIALECADSILRTIRVQDLRFEINDTIPADEFLTKLGE